MRFCFEKCETLAVEWVKILERRVFRMPSHARDTAKDARRECGIIGVHLAYVYIEKQWKSRAL